MTTHIEKIQALGNKMVENLNKQGVSASFEDGGMTLANKILDIKPFTTTISLSSDYTDIPINARLPNGQPFIIHLDGTLRAQYNDTYININVPIKDAPNTWIQEPNDTTTIVNPDSYGNFSSTYRVGTLPLGTYTYKSVFQGTSFYPQCQSSEVTITVRRHHIDKTNDTTTKRQLSFKLIDTDTNTALASHSYSLKAQLDMDNSPTPDFGNRTTDSNGMVTYSISSADVLKWMITIPETDICEGKTFTIQPSS